MIDGEKDEIPALVENALKSGLEANTITEQALTAAMTDIGVDFGAGRMFLPQVLLSAETMRAAFNKIKELTRVVRELNKLFDQLIKLAWKIASLAGVILFIIYSLTH